MLLNSHGKAARCRDILRYVYIYAEIFRTCCFSFPLPVIVIKESSEKTTRNVVLL